MRNTFPPAFQPNEIQEEGEEVEQQPPTQQPAPPLPTTPQENRPTPEVRFREEEEVQVLGTTRPPQQAPPVQHQHPTHGGPQTTTTTAHNNHLHGFGTAEQHGEIHRFGGPTPNNGIINNMEKTSQFPNMNYPNYNTGPPFGGFNPTYNAGPTFGGHNFSPGSGSTFTTPTTGAMLGASGWNNTGWNNNTTTGPGSFGTPPGAITHTAFGMHGPAGTVMAFGNNQYPATYGQMAAHSPPNMQAAAALKLQELQMKACTGNLTESDMNRFTILKSTMQTGTKIVTPSKSSDMTMRICNLLGWVGLKSDQEHLLHRETQGKWIRYKEAPTKAERQAVVESCFTQPLIQANPLFASILTDEFRDIIMDFRFSPKNFNGTKPSGGLGPLTFISRSTAEHENLQYFNRINALASSVTVADVERTTAGTPILPKDVDGTINVIELNLIAISSTLTQWAPPAREMRRLQDALKENYTRLKEMKNFQATYGNEIIYQLCRHLQKYFDHHCTELDLQMGNFPKFNIDFLIQGIENNNLQLSYSYGPLFATAKNPPTTPTPNDRTRNKKRTNEGLPKPSPGAGTDNGKISRAGQGCEEQKKLIKEYLNTHEHLPKIADIRIANGYNTDKELADALGIKEGTCLVWVLYCVCKKRCKRKDTHELNKATYKPNKAIEILKKGLSM